MVPSLGKFRDKRLTVPFLVLAGFFLLYFLLFFLGVGSGGKYSGLGNQNRMLRVKYSTGLNRCRRMILERTNWITSCAQLEMLRSMFETKTMANGLARKNHLPAKLLTSLDFRQEPSVLVMQCYDDKECLVKTHLVKILVHISNWIRA